MPHFWKSLTLGFAAIFLGFDALASTPRDIHHPIVIELFQSQGCSSCPPANANVMALSERPDVLTLSFQVTYWDHLGWKDTFAQPAFTARQYDYARGLGHGGVFTPQVVIDGRRDVVGIERGEIEGAISALPARPPGPDIALKNGIVTVGAGIGPAGGVWLVRYDPRIINVPIGRGENAGATLPHKNVVRELVKLGSWQGRAQSFALPAQRDPALRQAVLVQDSASAAILSAWRD